MRSKRFLLTVFLVTLFAPMCAFGDAVLDFQIPIFNSGTLSYGGGTDPLVGHNIQVSSVLGYGGTQNNFDSVAITNGLLNFTSGSETGTWTWGSGGSLAVSATGTFGGSTGTLLDGTFSDVYLQSVGIMQFELTLGGFTGTINSNLSSFYGFSTSSVDGSLGMVTHISAPAGQSFSNAPVLGGVVKTVDAAEGGGFLTTLSVFAAALLCGAIGVRVGMIKLTV